MLVKFGWIGILFFSALLLNSCNGNKAGDSSMKMSELEQLKYDNVQRKLNEVYEYASGVRESYSDTEMQVIKDALRAIQYDYNTENMGSQAQEKCKMLKERINLLKDSPERIFEFASASSTSSSQTASQSSNKGRVFSRKNLTIKTPLRQPYYFNAGDKVNVQIDCQGTTKVTLYDVHNYKSLRKWVVSNTLSEQVDIAENGIYLFELSPVNSHVMANVSITYEGSSQRRPHVREKLVDCQKGEFLATPVDSLLVKPIFKEPKKVGLRGNLKSVFSGKSRSVIPISIPAGCSTLLYSLRVSTNEQTVSSDGKFSKNLMGTTKQIRLFGVNVYEKRIGGDIIDRLLFSTRPPREEDAFCNMYIFTSASQARKFQDRKDGSASLKYDVSQSQMGTHSCNGELKFNGNKTIYMGFENERMRYDNYIWLEVAGLQRQVKYVRPVYEVR